LVVGEGDREFRLVCEGLTEEELIKKRRMRCPPRNVGSDQDLRLSWVIRMESTHFPMMALVERWRTKDCSVLTSLETAVFGARCHVLRLSSGHESTSTRFGRFYLNDVLQWSGQQAQRSHGACYRPVEARKLNHAFMSTRVIHSVTLASVETPEDPSTVAQCATDLVAATVRIQD